MKVLNLYACLGGNRYKWDEVAEEANIDMKVTAVELDPELAKLYQDRFPNDTVVVADAHQYLLDHYKEFDFIWSSPPCPSHSRIRFVNSKSEMYNRGKLDVVYPDMKLYQEIILLERYYEGMYVVENVIPYYESMRNPKKRGRHLYWTNFNLPSVLSDRKVLIRGSSDDLKNLSEFHDYDFSKYKGEQRRDKISRNLVDYEAGRTIFETALGIIRKKDVKQTELFND
jgi:DNA (cytosine-5)-methyltransferase 1